MSRGYDGPEIDDFRSASFGWGRDRGRNPSSDGNSRIALQNIHREEDRADGRDSEGRDRSDKDRPPVPRQERCKRFSRRESEPNTQTGTGNIRCGTSK